MSTGRLVAGVDCSTQATKVVVVGPDSGEVVATGRSVLIVLVRTFLSFIWRSNCTGAGRGSGPRTRRPTPKAPDADPSV